MTQFGPITSALTDAHHRFSTDHRGEVATYIPELSTANPDLFGIAVASLEGRIYVAGDVDVPFTIQSVSKPFVYGLALIDHGLEAVLARVGAEPTGEAFNAFSLEPETGRPKNPMINAGAIVTTSLVVAANPEDRFERILAMLSDCAGHPLEMDDAVYRSESATGDQNRALATAMHEAGSLQADVEESVDVYFRQCALLVTTRDLAVMTATLANGGVNPVTGVTVLPDESASHVLTLMGTCGMYDYSGEWLLRVGLPAKSGVAGALVAAKPGHFGIGLFSPRLDERGNSVRGVATCQNLAERFDVRLTNHRGHPAPVRYLEETAATLRSSSPRGEDERGFLTERGGAIVVWGLQGDLGFAETEHLMNALDPLQSLPPMSARWLILDLARVGRVSRIAQGILDGCVAELHARGITDVTADPEHRALLNGPLEVDGLDEALTWCEDELVREIDL